MTVATGPRHPRRPRRRRGPAAPTAGRGAGTQIAPGHPLRQTGRMLVLVIFDPAFDGPAGEAVWIVDTPANRSWFVRQRALDEGGAIFSLDRRDGPDGAVVHMIWNAQQHHPDWKTIEALGTPLSAATSRRPSGRTASSRRRLRLPPRPRLTGDLGYDRKQIGLTYSGVIVEYLPSRKTIARSKGAHGRSHETLHPSPGGGVRPRADGRGQRAGAHDRHRQQRRHDPHAGL